MPGAEPPPIPGTLGPARRFATALAGPISIFLHIQAASGILLLVAAAAALICASSRWHGAYDRLLRTPISVGVGDLVVSKPVHFWINDGLMVIFFFVVGIEIRREIAGGELSAVKRAALPVIAAVGGMLAPALIYHGINHASPGRDGWGIPMATDIAFAVGVLALLGKRVPAAARVLLLALAIIDDIGAILVIAVFYSTGLSLVGLGIAAGGVAGVLLLQAIGVRRPVAYIVPGVVLWVGFLRAGIHPSIAGVVLGLLTPARSWYGVGGFVTTVKSAVNEIRDRSARDDDHHAIVEVLDRVAEARREAVAPVIRLESALHPWVAYGIMPLFAFANAGVRITDVDLGVPASPRILAGVIVGLCAGKPAGILIASFIAVKLGVAALPRGVTWRAVTVVGLVAGIGFTMAIFIASLAFPEPGMLGSSKLAVLLASTVSGVLALLCGRLILSPAPPEVGAAISPEEAEASTEA